MSLWPCPKGPRNLRRAGLETEAHGHLYGEQGVKLRGKSWIAEYSAIVPYSGMLPANFN